MHHDGVRRERDQAPEFVNMEIIVPKTGPYLKGDVYAVDETTASRWARLSIAKKTNKTVGSLADKQRKAAKALAAKVDQQDAVDLAKLSKDALQTLAAERGIALSDGMNKAQLIEALEAD